MDILKRNRILFFIALILLIGNISLISTIWFNNTKNKKLSNSENMFDKKDKSKRNFLINELNLNSEQSTLYKEAKIKHQSNISLIRKEIRLNKKKINKELFKTTPNIIYINQLADSIGLLNAKFEKLNYSHFIKLKEILNNEQQEKFKNIINHHAFTGEANTKRKHRNRKH